MIGVLLAIMLACEFVKPKMFHFPIWLWIFVVWMYAISLMMRIFKTEISIEDFDEEPENNMNLNTSEPGSSSKNLAEDEP